MSKTSLLIKSVLTDSIGYSQGNERSEGWVEWTVEWTVEWRVDYICLMNGNVKDTEFLVTELCFVYYSRNTTVSKLSVNWQDLTISSWLGWNANLNFVLMWNSMYNYIR